MSEITRILSPELTRAFGWTLLHSLWQGLAIVLVLTLLMSALRRQSPQVRYVASLLGLAALLLASIITFLLLYRPFSLSALWSEGISGLWSHPGGGGMEGYYSEDTAYYFEGDYSRGDGGLVGMMSDYLRRNLPLIVAAWGIGVLVLTLRMLAQWTLVQRLRYSRSHPAPAAWQDCLDVLARRMGIPQQIPLRESLRIHTPMVIGALKPVILVPVGLFVQLPPEQVESALIHELAHIRRHDYLVNLIQAFLEILFFFNPAVWWISSLVRAEREHCCDDWAVNMTGDEVILVHTLASLEEYRSRHASLALALTGTRGSVLGRIQRLLYGEQIQQLPYRMVTGVAIVISLTAMAAFRAPQFTPDDLMFEEAAIDADEEAIAPEAPDLAELSDLAPEEELALAGLDTVPPTGVAAEMRRVQEEFQAKNREMQARLRELEKQVLQKEREIELLRDSESSTSQLTIEKRVKQLERERLIKEKELEVRRNAVEKQMMEKEIQAREMEQSMEGESEKESPDDQKMKQLEAGYKKLQEEARAIQQQANGVQRDIQKLMTEAQRMEQELWSQRNLAEKDLQLLVNQKEQEVLEIREQIQKLEMEQRKLEYEFELKIQELEEKMSNQE